MKTIGHYFLLFALAGCFNITSPAESEVQKSDEHVSLVASAASLKEADTEKKAPGFGCAYLVTVTDDFIVAAYKNGELIPETKRELLVDCFGASAEKIHVEVKAGDWLVFNVVHNPIRWGGSKYFAVAGCRAQNEFGFVSDPASPNWSICDNPVKAPGFIRHRDEGRQTRALQIENPWGDGDQFIRNYAGDSFGGKPLWGRERSTWVKFVAPNGSAPENKAPENVKKSEPMKLKRWPIQILSAIYGTGGKNADVSEKVKGYVEKQQVFSANPADLGADPNPRWNKSLQIVYMKDGVRREQRRNENERILPESFYGPQDAAELRSWLVESRWSGEQGEIQFHSDGTFTSPGKEGIHQWEATGAKKMRLTWAGQPASEFLFDHTWSRISEVENGRNSFHALQ